MLNVVLQKVVYVDLLTLEMEGTAQELPLAYLQTAVQPAYYRVPHPARAQEGEVVFRFLLQVKTEQCKI